MASLPRPARPSATANPPPMNPPPSLPMPKQRKTSTSSIDGLTTSPSPATSPATTSAIPQRLSNRAVSSSNVNTTQNAQNTTTQASNAAALTPAKTLRKTISYNSFPKPPSSRSPSVASIDSTNSITTPRASSNGSSLYNSAPNRASSLRAESARKSAAASAAAAIDENSVEDGDEIEDAPRGRERPSSSSTHKDKGNVVISVRVRPEKDSKDEAGGAGDWVIEGKKSLVSYRGKEGGEYYYDNCFTTNDKNSRVYDQAAKRLVRRVMEGYNGTVFAYGMTGTGKTYSMQGTATSPGVIPLAITDIFSYIRETPHREFLLRVSYLEIYNEKIFDLLAAQTASTPAAQQGEDIKLREDSKGNVYATPLKEEIVQSPTQLLRVISRGDQLRRTFSTQYNTRSSRSHAVVQIVVESRERNAGGVTHKEDTKRPAIPGGVRVSTLSLIDLAGSERAAENKERRTEGAHINKSLLTLGNVVSKLSGKRDKEGRPTDKDGKHLPYRDSKLTRLLQPALSGNSLISILCTIQLGAVGSSAISGHHTIETLNTLKFAARARNNIVSHAKRAEEAHNMDAGSRALLDRYRLEITELRKQLEEQKAGKEKSTPEPEEKEEKKGEEKIKEAEEADQRHEEQLLEMQLARTALKERIEHLNRLILSSKSIGVNAGRSFSSLSLVHPRTSTLTESTGTGYSKSVRSSASTATLDAQIRDYANRGSVNSVSTMNTGFEDEEDTIGENGDGTATLTAQVKSLQSDLADKNRYIATLEKRLLQARRSSRSRLSMGFASRTSVASAEQGGEDALIQAKDAEIAELREKLDDKDRMLAALRSAARKRDTADTSFSASTVHAFSGEEQVSSPTTAGVDLHSQDKDIHAGTRGRSVEGVRRNGAFSPTLEANGRRSSLGPGTSALRNSLVGNTPANILLQRGQNSPRSPTWEKKNHGVDEMTRMLDDMIRQKMESESNYDYNARDTAGSRYSLVSGPNGVRPLTGGNDKLDVRNGSGRLSTDSSRLNGWEPNSNRRRRSSLLDYGSPPGDGPILKPLPDRPSKRHNRMGSKDQANGLTSPQLVERPPISPTTSSTSTTKTPTPATMNNTTTYSHSTAAATQAIEALRSNTTGRRVPPPTPDSSYSSPGKDAGGMSAEDTSGDDDDDDRNENLVNGQVDDGKRTDTKQASLERIAAMIAGSG